MKYEVIKANRSKYPVEKMCKILKVSRSGFKKWEKRQVKPSSNKLMLMAEIKAIHVKNRQAYGYLRVTKELKRRRYWIGRKKQHV